jgi:hypothetical protein
LWTAIPYASGLRNWDQEEFDKLLTLSTYYVQYSHANSLAGLAAYATSNADWGRQQARAVALFHSYVSMYALGIFDPTVDGQAIEAAFPRFVYEPSPGAGRLSIRVKHSGRRQVVLAVRSTGAPLRAIVVELRRGRRLVARAQLARVGTTRQRLKLRNAHGPRFKPGRYTLRVRAAGKTLLTRAVRIRHGHPPGSPRGLRSTPDH